MRTPFFLPFFILIFTAWLAVPAALGDEGKAQLGIYLQELDDEHREKFEFEGEGVLVLGTVEGSGAAEAGLEKGDIIMAFNGELIETPEDLSEAIAHTRPGQKVKVLLFSDGDTRKVKVKMGKAGDHPIPPPPPPAEVPDPRAPDKFMFHYKNIVPYMGVALQELPDQLAAFFEAKHGVLIATVEENGPAEDAGLRAGDVVIRFDGVPVKTTADLYKELYEAKPGDEVELDIVRRGKKKEVSLTLGKKKTDSPWSQGFFLDKDKKLPHLYRVPPAPDYHKFPDMPEMPQFKYRYALPEGGHLDLEGMKDFKKEMEKLRDELKELRDEMKALKKEI
jgi:membrane-associated protease RseP (regulator of RpoE activity)